MIISLIIGIYRMNYKMIFPGNYNMLYEKLNCKENKYLYSDIYVFKHINKYIRINTYFI